LVEAAIRSGEGVLADDGPLVATARLVQNFRTYEADVDPAIVASGPSLDE